MHEYGGVAGAPYVQLQLIMTSISYDIGPDSHSAGRA